jgi:transposase-like protein
MTDECKHHSPEEKVAILRQHLIDKVPISTLCDEHQHHSTVFYRWLRLVAQAFAP